MRPALKTYGGAADGGIQRHRHSPPWAVCRRAPALLPGKSAALKILSCTPAARSLHRTDEEGTNRAVPAGLGGQRGWHAGRHVAACPMSRSVPEPFKSSALAARRVLGGEAAPAWSSGLTAPPRRPVIQSAAISIRRICLLYFTLLCLVLRAFAPGADSRAVGPLAAAPKSTPGGQGRDGRPYGGLPLIRVNPNAQAPFKFPFIPRGC